MAALTPYQKFWGLKENWWEQVFDGKVAYLGPQVFDKGYHDGTKEPGYYDSIKKACEFASQHLNQKLSISFYKELHKRACAHFEAYQLGLFSPAQRSRSRISALFDTLPRFSRDSLFKKFREYTEIKSLGMSWNYLSGSEKVIRLKQLNLTEEQFFKKRSTASKWIKHFNQRVDNKITQINTYIEQRSHTLGLTHPMAKLCRVFELVYIHYFCTSEEAELAMERLFFNYNHQVDKAKSLEVKINLVADLYQVSEWVHPFPDGQGRTDLVTLAGELCKIGANPSILNEPYVSTFNFYEEWVDYLKIGMKDWEGKVERYNQLEKFKKLLILALVLVGIYELFREIYQRTLT